MKNRVYLIVAILVLIVAGGGYYGYTYWMNYKHSPAAEAAKADAEKKDIISHLSKLMVLPSGDPILFKVSNEDVMKSQQLFFKDTKNGDVLLVYQNEGKAILYRPANDMIVNSGPINFDQKGNQQASAPVTNEATTSSKTTTSTTKNTTQKAKK